MKTRPDRRGKYAGLESVPSEYRPPVKNTRVLLMPDRTKIICRHRKDENEDYWTAEVPIEIAKEIFTDD